MTSTGTGTNTRSATITMTDVREVLWRIQSDLRTLRVQHQMIDEAFELGAIADLQQFIYRNFVDRISFEFERGGVVQPGSVAYSLSRQWQGEDGDPSGGLRYRDLRGCAFAIVLNTTSIWDRLSVTERKEFYEGLTMAWGSATPRAIAGVWTADRAYGSGGLGASRLVLK